MKMEQRSDGPPSRATNFATQNDMVPFVRTLTECTTQVLTFAKGLPGIRYLLQDIPFAETCRLLSSGGGCFLKSAAEATIHSTNKAARQSGQAVIWCTEILGCLTLASYTEDNLGSVQTSLGLIIGTLDEILEALELHFHLVGLVPSKNTPLSDFLYADAGPIGNLDKRPGEVAFFPKSTTPDSNNETQDTPYYRYASDPLLPWRIHATDHSDGRETKKKVGAAVEHVISLEQRFLLEAGFGRKKQIAFEQKADREFRASNELPEEVMMTNPTNALKHKLDVY
ncbi:unnamed protein product [Dibothriocephalus latus]|uniref:Uncharacterized protein n=1 Tax=Dibothriocephalus latus TaxID=60516 RepID=A0A3P7NTQ0_DIBLA|nr:unnamed protein product [Dibothriocephalus latus]